MTSRERQDVYFKQGLRFSADIPFCVNCAHYYPHYIKGGPPMYTISMVPLDCGHCCYPRSKFRDAWDTCGYFKNKEESK